MGARGRKKKIYKIKDYNQYKHWEYKEVIKDVMRNIVIAKHLCRDPYYKFAVWQIIKTNGEYWNDHWHELRKLREPTESIKDVPDVDLIIRYVVTWSYDNKPRPEDKHNRSRCYVVSCNLYFILDAMRDWIENDVKEKGCKIYGFIPPAEVELKEGVSR